MRFKTERRLLDLYFAVQFNIIAMVCPQDFPSLKIGCYEDRDHRDLGNVMTSSSNTPSVCLKRCSGLGFAFASSGDPALTCGGVWRNTVYCLVPLYNKFLGCYKESVPRDLWGLETTATTNRCLKICQSSGYAYAAVQNDSRCTCGVSYGRYGKADPFTCNCTKDTNTVYETGGIWKMEELFYGNVQQSPPLARRHVIYKETSVDDLYLCMSYCEKNSLCKSINYNHMTRTCEMNNVTSLEGESQARQGFYYYEPVGKIFNHH